MEEFNKFYEIVKRLRKECPWDREQTHKTLRRCLLEESYEVLHSIDEDNKEELKKELGDLLLQIVFHASIAEDENSFTLKELIEEETKKLIYRHPHVFGDTIVSGSEEVKKNWEHFKLKEGRKSVLSGIPDTLPALFKAFRIQEKASKVGFDWKDPAPAFEKVTEEINELKKNIETEKSREDIEDEFGDVLFSLVNYARLVKINPEDALRKTITKFTDRFSKIEEYAILSGKNLEEMTLEEMDEVWNKSKK
ncbi:MAG: nucleoside triphosphate pyrophosphohydrolase [Ignavibacteria bacterium]|nr:nucleoside triphosphate pyrophosphohydrolase [Ignavibacteria bacterium]